MIIYKKDTSGKTRFLEVKTEGAELIQLSGVLGTSKIIEHRKTCIGKNIGKSNETTPEAQAISEMESKIKDKLTEGYFNTIEEVQTETVILPMLAKDYKKESHKIDWSNFTYAQPKLDGMRCLAFLNDDITLLSRDGKIIENMDHIKEALKKLTNLRKGTILDGELYSHGLSFQENMKLIKKYRKGETETIGYHIYDMVEDECFDQRTPSNKMEFDFPLVKVETYSVKSEDQLKEFHAQFIQDGYEGTIVRHSNDSYKVNGRSSSLLKYKDFLDLACKIIDVIPAEQRPEWGIPVLEHNGKQFRAGMKFTHEARKEFLINKSNYIGKTAEIRFFEYTDDGNPRFPIMFGIRLDC